MILLALDGAWRSGASPQAIADAIEARQARNMKRTWLDWRTVPDGTPIEHDRTQDARAPVLAVLFARARRGAPLIVRAHSHDGVIYDVGRIQRGRAASGDWGLFLDGIYWRTVRVGKSTTQEPTTRGGASGVRCRTQRDAMDLAGETLTNLGMRVKA